MNKPMTKKSIHRSVAPWLAGLAALLPLSPAVTQTPSHDPLADEIVRALPHPGELEALAPALDRSVGALMQLEVGPLVDALDPYRRGYDHGRPGRTLGELAARDDPDFERRMRASLYGATGEMSHMVGALAAAAPSIAASLRQMENAIGAAIDHYDAPPPPPDDEREWDGD